MKRVWNWASDGDFVGMYLVLQPLYTRTEELELEEGLR